MRARASSSPEYGERWLDLKQLQPTDFHVPSLVVVLKKTVFQRKTMKRLEYCIYCERKLGTYVRKKHEET